MSKRFYYSLAIIAALAVCVRLIAIPLLGSGLGGNPVDVYYVDREAAKIVLGLQNPYLFSGYTNHYGGSVTFAYLPMIPIFYAPFLLAGVDIRAGSVVADVVIIVTMYFIARALLKNPSSRLSFLGSFVYAILPVSIMLTSMSGTNIMIGAMFLILSLTLVLYERNLLAGVFLGLALATNQFIFLVFPILALYCLRKKNYLTVLFSLIVSCSILVPFLVSSPSNFLYDVLYFQLQRPIQKDGVWGLYYMVYSLSGLRIDTFVRVLIFIVPASVFMWFLSTSAKKLFAGVVFISALGAFLIPVDGFWNYFLIPMAVACATIPVVVNLWIERQRVAPLKIAKIE